MNKMRMMIALGLLGTIAGCMQVSASDLQEEFLKDLAEGVTARWEHNENDDLMTRAEFVDYRRLLVNEEYSKLESYKDKSFDDEEFDLLAHTYIDALETQLHALDYYVDHESIYIAQWEAGYNVRAAIIPTLYDEYELDIDEDQVEYLRETYPYGSDLSEAGKDSGVVKCDVEVFKNDDITITIVGMKTDPDTSEQALMFKVENNGEKDIVVSSENEQIMINDKVMDITPAIEVKAGKKKSEVMVLDAAQLKENEVDKITKLRFRLCIKESDAIKEVDKSDIIYLAVDESNAVTKGEAPSEREITKKIQELLNAEGYDCGEPDGVAGDVTNKALKEFEKKHMLPETTEITEELLIKMEESVDKK